MPFGRGGLLAVRHHPRDLHHTAIGKVAELGRGDHPLGAELVVHELRGVLADAETHRPQLGPDRLRLGHTGKRRRIRAGDDTGQGLADGTVAAHVGTGGGQRARGPDNVEPRDWPKQCSNVPAVASAST